MAKTHTLLEPIEYDGKTYTHAQVLKRPRVKDRINASRYVEDTFGQHNSDAVLCATLAQVAQFSTTAKMENPVKLDADTVTNEMEYTDFTELVKHMAGTDFLGSTKVSSGKPSTPSAAPDTAQAANS